MPPRNPELPEGTDSIINGAMDTGAGAGASTGSSGGDLGGSASGIGGGASGTGGLAGGLGGSTGGLSGGLGASSGSGLGGGTTGAGSNAGGTGLSTGGASGGGFLAKSGGDDTGGTATGGGGADGGGSTRDKLVQGVRSQVSTLTDQATGKAREYADTGKERATNALDDLAEVINDAARSIDERLGNQYGEYAHRAAGYVTDFSQNLRGKSVDELLDDTRGLIRQSPGAAIGAAALIGFTLVRLVKAGLDNERDVQFTPDRGRGIEFQPDTGGTGTGTGTGA